MTTTDIELLLNSNTGPLSKPFTPPRAAPREPETDPLTSPFTQVDTLRLAASEKLRRPDSTPGALADEARHCWDLKRPKPGATDERKNKFGDKR